MRKYKREKIRMGWLQTVHIDRAWDIWWEWFMVVEDDDFTYLVDLYDYD